MLVRSAPPSHGSVCGCRESQPGCGLRMRTGMIRVELSESKVFGGERCIEYDSPSIELEWPGGGPGGAPCTEAPPVP